jgi:2-oxoglutarate dehydrogenase E2 component (dihydrolipoamide succinyltransferase)
VTPLVRKLAKEHGVELDSLNGTGVGGRIRKQDVLAAAEAAKQAAAAPAPQAPAEQPAAAAPAARAAAPEVSTLRGTTEKMSRLRQTIAKRMVESLQVAAQLTATVEVDLTAISQIRAKVKDDFKKREGASLSYLRLLRRLPSRHSRRTSAERDDRHRGTHHYYPGSSISALPWDTDRVCWFR